jgi:hypothetical protein
MYFIAGEKQQNSCQKPPGSKKVLAFGRKL